MADYAARELLKMDFYSFSKSTAVHVPPYGGVSQFELNIERLKSVIPFLSSSQYKNNYLLIKVVSISVILIFLQTLQKT